MSTTPPGLRRPSLLASFAFGAPIALAILLLPTLFILVPSIGTRSTQTETVTTPASSGPEQVHLTVKEWSFSPAALQLPLGKPVTLVLDNQGKLDHDVTIPSLGVSLAAGAGKTASQTVTLSKDGSFPFLCSLPGHKEAGMSGKVQVGGSTTSASTTTGMPGMGMNSPATANGAAEMASHAAVASVPIKANQPLSSRMEGETRVFDLQAVAFKWEVLPGEFVDAFGYAGADGVATVPGPLIRVTEGDHVRIHFTNHLPEATVIHFHGPRLPNAMDGVADITQKAVQPGEAFSYEFTANPTGTFMYHTHYNSAEQEGKGLYGVFQVDPKAGARVAAETEAFQILSEMDGYYLINGHSFPATEPIEARVGQRVLIHLVNLGQMTHPMHMHGAPFQIVGTDGYPVPEAARLTKDVIDIAPGERYDLLMNADNPGTWLFHCHILSHVQNHGVEPGGMLTVIKVDE